MTSRIYEKFKQIEQIGMKGVLSHWLTFNTRTLVDLTHEEADKDPWTACWSGLEYFRWNFSEPKSRWQKYDVELFPEKFPDILQWKNGLYHFTFTNNESHYGTIFIDNDNLLVCNTYGGVKHICFSKNNTDEWLQSFVNELMSNRPSYFTFLKLFGIPFDSLDVVFRKDITENSSTGIYRDFHYTYNSNPTCWLYDGGDVNRLYADVVDP